MTAARTCVLEKYVTFSGRAQRSELWWFFLFTLAGSFVLGLVDGVLFGVQALSILWSLALILPGISVGVRRLHDQDKSGWWLLIAFVPLIGFLVLLYFYVQRGTDGPNQFGPDPLA